ncbi:HEXXH motif-containing putative peptide modification protein [Actinoplanes sp. DH11]|uniref:aKG-HExxH-type peptide beta-hydroxylase n=1 Tax=Actinoplanes sp. DH11 TaxID=2857011 RepID=UPI001E377210|nr:HEXXH motif-containing putative peptide modification protein [Actinoplanes sp. DH11]
MSPRHFTLTDAAFASLGAGRPDPGTLGTLLRAQLSRNLLLLREVRRRQIAPAWFDRLGATGPDDAKHLITDPMTGLWAARALRAGDAADHPRPGGHRLTAVHHGLTLGVRVEDADPLREGFGLPPAEDHGTAALSRWQTLLDEAWLTLTSRHRPAAEVLAAVLRVIVPVRPDPAAEGISATSSEAFGAVALSAPADAAALAVGLLHETQHSVLNAVNLLFELVHPGGPAGYSPWRDDPRPAAGVLHGAYAYLAVTRFWRAELAHSGDRGAAFEFARWRVAVADAAGRLLDGGELTAAGTRFVTALRAEVRPWLDEPVDGEAVRLADLARTDHHLRWRLRNLTVPPEHTAELARAWRAGRPAPAVPSVPARGTGRALENSPRLRLIRSHLRNPGTAAVPDARDTAGDVACVRGDRVTALHAYHRDLREERDRDPAWSGLALVSPHRGLRCRPEVVKAAALAVPEADVDALADWLSG